MACTGTVADERPVQGPAQDERASRAEAGGPRFAVASTQAERSTLVVSSPSGIVSVLADLPAGSYELADLPPDAAVSRIERSDDGWGRGDLKVTTVLGVQNGHTLWSMGSEPVGTIRAPQLPVPIPPKAQEWVFLGGGGHQPEVAKETISVDRDQLSASGAVDLFFRVTQEGVPIYAGYSIGVPIVHTGASQGVASTPPAPRSSWTDKPTLVELRYLNTSDAPEPVSLAISGFRGSRWFASRGADPIDARDVKPGELARVVEALDPGFHDGFFAEVLRVQRGPDGGGFSEMKLRQAVPASGVRETLSYTAADLPPTFAGLVWDARSRRVYPDWTNVSCKTTPYVLLRTSWTLRAPVESRSIQVAVLSPASPWVEMPRLPPEEEREVSAALDDQTWTLSIYIEALAMDGPYAHAAGIDGEWTPADLGQTACFVGYAVRVRSQPSPRSP